MGTIRMKQLTLVVLLGMLLGGCASGTVSGYGQGGQMADGRSYAEARADNTITAAVNRLLVQDSRIQAIGIDVSTVNQVVTLRGSVPNSEIAGLAQRLAASVSGVKAVVNQLSFSH